MMREVKLDAQVVGCGFKIRDNEERENWPDHPLIIMVRGEA